MPHGQHSIKKLSGYGAFSRVITSGKHFEKKPIKAFVKILQENETSIRFGFTVVRSIKKAVHRNRLKRLMKEALKDKRKNLFQWMEPGTRTELVFMYCGNANPGMVLFSSIEKSIEALCTMIRPSLRPEKK